ncbi:MAG: DUF4214 domain-containing protein [Pseudomonadota bacterium]
MTAQTMFLTDGDDVYVQPLSDKDVWRDYNLKAGNDTVRLYEGSVTGGPGNDQVIRLDSPEFWHQITVNYWDSPAGVLVDLQAGFADDGWGTRDTLVGVTQVGGTWHGDKMYGSAADETFNSGGGSNTIDGRGGSDLLYLPTNREGMTLADYKIVVSIDGLSATITCDSLPGFKDVISNIERISAGWPNSSALIDFIKPDDMANQGLLAADANRWNAAAKLGTALELSYSFVASAPPEGPGAGGFQAFTSGQRDAVRAILASVSALTGLSFHEVADSAASHGQLSFGASQQVDTKGVSAMPGEAGAGQVWIDIDTLLNLAPGSEGYAVLLHEIGHALGLRHPRNIEPGEAYALQLNPANDRSSFSVMSETASADGLFPSSWSTLDVTALRTLYGSRASAGGDTVYVLGGLRFTSETSIVDDGGIDTLDASGARTGAMIDLTPGHLSSVGVTGAGIGAVANLGLGTATWIENATGSDFDDVILGNVLDNALKGGKGNDWLDGGAGKDSAVFDGARTDYLLSNAYGKVFVTARDGSGGFDTLLNIETLVFRDQSVALSGAALGADLHIDVDQNASAGGTLPLPAASVGALTYTLLQDGSNGHATVSAAGVFSYTPNQGFASGDTFSYRLTEAGKGSNTYLGFVDVRPVTAQQLGGSGADVMLGSGSADLIDAGSGNDSIRGSLGNDTIDGGAGFDLMLYAGLRADYLFKAAGGATGVLKAGADGSDLLRNVERVLFDDGAVALDLAGAAGQAYRVYQAAFDRKPDAGGLGFWIAQMDRGTSLADVAAGFMQSAEFTALYGAAPSASDFVTRLYSNVLHRAPEQGGFDFWVKAVAGGFSRAEVLAQFAESTENQAQLIGVIANGIDYLPFG